MIDLFRSRDSRRRRALLGALWGALWGPLWGPLAALGLAACASGPTPAPDVDAIVEGCPLIPRAQNAAFLEFQTNRDAVLARMTMPARHSLLVQVREGRTRAFLAMPQLTDMAGVTVEPHSGYTFVVDAQDPETLAALSQAMAGQSAMIETVVPNALLYPTAVEPNDPCYAIQWHYWTQDRRGERRAPGGANLPARWAETTGSADIVVAVIDTGGAQNADTANVVAGYDFVSDVANAGDGDGRDRNPADPGDAFSSFHGAHVAGTVGAVATDNGAGVAGAAWSVSVQPVRALGRFGGTTADIIDAIRWSAGLRVPGVPRNPTPARVINLSLGGGGRCPLPMQRAIDDATAAGALVIAAAGNEAQDAGDTQPAGCDNVLTVAAGDFDGALARYSNFGSTVELLAPGGDVQADLNRDGVADGVASTLRDRFALYNGTSMAAPHVAGVAALILAQEPELTPAALQARLLETAVPRTTRQCPQPCGAGLLNAAP